MLASVSFYTLASVTVVAASAINSAPEGKIARRGYGPGYGGGGTTATTTASNYYQQATSAYSYTAEATSYGLPAIFGTFCYLPSQIATAQSWLAGGITAQVALTTLSQVALSFQQAVQPFVSCGTCGLTTAGLTAFQKLVQSISTGLMYLIGQCQTIYPNQWSNILFSAFGQFGVVFPQLFNFCNTVGLPVVQMFGGQFVQSFYSINIEAVNYSFSQYGLI